MKHLISLIILLVFLGKTPDLAIAQQDVTYPVLMQLVENHIKLYEPIKIKIKNGEDVDCDKKRMVGETNALFNTLKSLENKGGLQPGEMCHLMRMQAKILGIAGGILKRQGKDFGRRSFDIARKNINDSRFPGCIEVREAFVKSVSDFINLPWYRPLVMNALDVNLKEESKTALGVLKGLKPSATLSQSDYNKYKSTIEDYLD